MKRIFVILVLLLAAAAWYFYDPYLRPHVEKLTGAVPMSEGNRVLVGGTSATTPAGSKGTPAAAAPKSVVPSKSSSTPASGTARPSTPPKSELEEALAAKYPLPEILPLLTIVDQWRNVPANAYPPEITAKVAVPFQLVVNGQAIGATNVPPGTPLKPVRLIGDQLTIASLANPDMNTQIPVDQTDFKERIESRYRQFVETKHREVEAKRQRARELVAQDPSRLGQLTGKGAPAATVVDAGGDPRIAPVVSSLRSGEIASVTFEEARSFQWNGSETVGGDFAGTYDTVTVHFEVSTIFGKFPVDYKALLRGGRVVGWIDPVTEDRAS